MPSSHLQTAGYVVAFALAAGAAFCCAEPAVAQSEPSPTPAPPAVSAAPLASPAPSAEPLATPVPTPTPPLRELLLEAGYTLGKVYNNYANGITGNGTSYVASGAYRLGSWAVKLDDRSDQYTTQINVPGPPGPGTGFLAPDGTYEVVPPFTGRVTSIDTRLEHQAFTKNVYLGLSYIDTSTTYGYPSLRGVGGGIEQYSNFTPFGLYGFLFYYPNVSGTFLQTDAKSPNFGKSYGVNFSELKYSFETALPLSYDFYLYFGYGGYRMLTGGDNTAQNVEGPFLGLGTRLFRAGAALDEPEVTRVKQTVPNYTGMLQGAFSSGGENTVGALAGPSSSGSYQIGAQYLVGPYAFLANLHNTSFSSSQTINNQTTTVKTNDSLIQENALVSVTPHMFYLGLGLMQKSASAGYTSQFGWGLGGAKLPNLVARFAYYGSVFYYFAPATYTAPGAAPVSQSREYLVYDYGVTYRPLKHEYLYLGYWGYHGNAGSSPIDETHSGPYAGIGYRF